MYNQLNFPKGLFLSFENSRFFAKTNDREGVIKTVNKQADYLESFCFRKVCPYNSFIVLIGKNILPEVGSKIKPYLL